MPLDPMQRVARPIERDTPLWYLGRAAGPDCGKSRSLRRVRIPLSPCRLRAARRPRRSALTSPKGRGRTCTCPVATGSAGRAPCRTSTATRTTGSAAPREYEPSHCASSSSSGCKHGARARGRCCDPGSGQDPTPPSGRSAVRSERSRRRRPRPGGPSACGSPGGSSRSRAQW